MQADSSWINDRDAFQTAAESLRHQLQVHCYRMLGSLHEAEDLVQETFLRAWRARERFEARTSFRNWLYRIATNACLNAIAQRKTRRVWPDAYGPPADAPLQGSPATEVAWLEPYPDTALHDLADSAPGPDARYELQESVQLAFIAAIQQLPARQRAVLLLRDVLGWSAAETAQLLDASVASVNSALQRARATLERETSAEPVATPEADERDLLERYVKTWESYDMDAFAALLREDAVLRMPPWRQWYLGPRAIRDFFLWVRQRREVAAWRVVRTGANGQPAFGHYARIGDSDEFVAHNIQILTLDAGRIRVLTAFRDPALFAKFGLPATLQ